MLSSLMEKMLVTMSVILTITAAPSMARADYIRNGKIVDCFCTDKSGARVDLGQTTCIQVDGRMFTAQCQMSQNVPMWRETSQGCLSSSLELPQSKPVLNAFSIDAKI